MRLGKVRVAKIFFIADDSALSRTAASRTLRCPDHNSNLHVPLTNGLKYFRLWLRFRRVIKTLVSKKLTRQGMIPRGVMFWRIFY